MYWANFLHIYQPANEAREIFDRVVAESYRPLIRSLLDHSEAKVTLNINAVLTERLRAEYPELIGDLVKVAKRGQIEFTGSAKYHTLLPFLPEDEIERQISLNFETNRQILGQSYSPIGFFPPEMGYSPKILPILKKLGYKWLILDEIAYNGKTGQVKNDKSYQIAGTNLRVFFRQRAPSNLIMAAYARNYDDLKAFLKEDFLAGNYLVTGMDGETFGHHRPGLQTLLTELLAAKEFEHAFFGDLARLFPETETVMPMISTWASSQKDIEEGIQFVSWNEPDNEIQKYQWELQHLVMDEVKEKIKEKKEERGNEEARKKLDEGLASDQFFWASAKPWWSLEVIELGAWTLLDALKSLPDPDLRVVDKAYGLYLKIIAKAFEWQRTGHVRDLSHQMKEEARIPFKDRTVGEPWVYEAFVKLMREEMEKATRKENFEEAILWRDAIWKMETKNDVFDAVHAVEILRRRLSNKDVLDMIGKYRDQYERLVSGQPEQRGV